MSTTHRTAKPVTVTVGNVKVRVYTITRADGYTFHQVADYSTGKRKLRSFSSLPEAKAEALRLARLLANGETEAATMRGTDAASFGRASELLRPIGDPLELVAARYAKAVEILGGDGGLLEAACRFYKERSPANLPDVKIEQAVTELLTVKEQQGKSGDYLSDLRIRLAKLTAAFPGNHVASIGQADAQRWLDAIKGAPQTVLNCRRVAITLFAFCERRGYIPKGSNPFEATERPKVRGGSVEIYTPAEVAALLANASEHLAPALAIAAFCGVRTAELMRLTWGDVDLVGGFVTVSAEKSKTASRRLVPIQPNLAAWLTPHAKKAGRVWHRQEWRYVDALQQAAQKGGVTFKDNGLRHSFASYRLAQTQSAAQVSLEMGNSPGMVFAHYRELVKPADAERWFAIAPDQPANVVSLNQQAAA